MRNIKTEIIIKRFSQILLVVILSSVFYFFIKNKIIKYLLLFIAFCTLVFFYYKQKTNVLLGNEKTLYSLLIQVFLAILTTIVTSSVFPGYEIKIFQSQKIIIKNQEENKKIQKEQYNNLKKQIEQKTRNESEYLKLVGIIKEKERYLSKIPNDSILIREINQLKKDQIILQEKMRENVNLFSDNFSPDHNRLKNGMQIKNSSNITVEEIYKSLKIEEILNEQKELLKKIPHIINKDKVSLQKKLKYNSSEFAIIAEAVYHLYNYNERLTLVNELFKHSIKSSFYGHENYGDFLYKEKKYTDALIQYDNYINKIQNANFNTSEINSTSLSQIYSKKANCYQQILDFDNANLFLSKAVKLSNSDVVKGFIYGDFGSVALGRNNNIQAKKYLELSLKYFKPYMNKEIPFFYNSSLAKAIINSDIDEAERLILNQIDICSKDNNSKKMRFARYVYGEILIKKKEYTKAVTEFVILETYFKKNIKSIDINQYIQLLSKMHEAYIYIDDYKLADEKLMQIITLINSNINNDNNITYRIILAKAYTNMAKFCNLKKKEQNAIENYENSFIVLKELINKLPESMIYKKRYIENIIAYYQISKDAYSLYALGYVLSTVSMENYSENEYIKKVKSSSKFIFEINKDLSFFPAKSYFNHKRFNIPKNKKIDNWIIRKNWSSKFFINKNNNLFILLLTDDNWEQIELFKKTTKAQQKI